jgi:hypothetical protein
VCEEDEELILVELVFECPTVDETPMDPVSFPD